MRLLLVGCGKMGGVLRQGWARAKLPADVVDPSGGQYSALNNIPAAYAPDTIVFAVKPQALSALLPEYAARFGDTPLYISIAAGKGLEFYAAHLGAARVIRAMPNTPALVGQGMTLLAAGAQANEEDRNMATQLFEAVGVVRWLADEALMHAGTAISGSGPAYAFLFMEALAEAGEKLGLPRDLAATLAVETVAGTAALARDSHDFAALRQQVASPGGTTEAALSALMDGDALKRLMAEAVARAAARSKELNQ